MLKQKKIVAIGRPSRVAHPKIHQRMLKHLLFHLVPLANCSMAPKGVAENAESRAVDTAGSSPNDSPDNAETIFGAATAAARGEVAHPKIHQRMLKR